MLRNSFRAIWQPVQIKPKSKSRYGLQAMPQKGSEPIQGKKNRRHLVGPAIELKKNSRFRSYFSSFSSAFNAARASSTPPISSMTFLAFNSASMETSFDPLAALDDFTAAGFAAGRDFLVAPLGRPRLPPPTPFLMFERMVLMNAVLVLTPSAARASRT